MTSSTDQNKHDNKNKNIGELLHPLLKFDNRSAFDMEWTCTKNIKQDIKITGDYVQIETIFTPKYIENLI